MPFENENDPKLPDMVKELPEEDRRQWLEVWNNTFANCQDEGDDADACEAAAFRQANGVLFGGTDKASAGDELAQGAPEGSEGSAVEEEQEDADTTEDIESSEEAQSEEADTGEPVSESEDDGTEVVELADKPTKDGKAAKARQDAPNYGPSDSRMLCANCAHGSHGYCHLFDFDHDKDHVCGRWELGPPDGAFVGFFLPSKAATELALAGGLKADDLHLTLVYLGKADEIEHPDELKRLVAEMAMRTPPIEAKVGGIIHFDTTEVDNTQPFCTHCDSVELPSLRQMLVDELEFAGFEVAKAHGFTPHITLKYLKADAPFPARQITERPVIFDTLSLALAGKRFNFLLTGSPMHKAGARHNRYDKGTVQDIHDKAVKLGAECAGGKRLVYKAVTFEQEAGHIRAAWYPGP